MGRGGSPPCTLHCFVSLGAHACGCMSLHVCAFFWFLAQGVASRLGGFPKWEPCQREHPHARVTPRIFGLLLCHARHPLIVLSLIIIFPSLHHTHTTFFSSCVVCNNTATHIDNLHVYLSTLLLKTPIKSNSE